jgi:outer membrane receptor protein involved in Fe transport
MVEAFMRRNTPWLLAMIMLVAWAGSARAQGNPTGTLSGQVVDPAGLPLPGVTVTVESPALQGSRTAVSSANGDYILPFLPPGDYTATAALAGFQTRKQTVRIQIAETLSLNITLALASVSESVEVTAQAPTEIGQTTTVSSTYKADFIERLPVGRTLTNATLLAPGVTDNGPNGNIMISGALSYENLFLINGVVVNENLRAQPRNLFIEDALQETKVSTASISAEYGRFQGGVINAITKSGGNDFSGSLRVTFNNDSWGALTPFPGDQNIDKTVPTYELTGGGPILRDRLWFFGAGRFENQQENRTLDYTAANYVRDDEERRYEGKLTYALTKSHTFKGAYTKRKLETTNNSFGTIMDRNSLYNNANDEDLVSVNYTGVLTNSLFVEGQYSQRDYAILGSGSLFTDFVRGTPIWDRSREQARFNSPTFCAVCGSGVENRNNWNYLGKVSYFLSTPRIGSHNVVAGFDVFKETRQNDNYQSGTSYRIQASSSVIQGETIYPIFRDDRTTFVEWLPLVDSSVGNDLRTYSLFVNDTWRYNDRVTFNIGVRYDRNRSKDQSGLEVVNDSAFSPRLGATWDIKGDGVWRANAGFARYVTAINTALVDAGSAGGRTATYSYFYLGPNVNTDANAPLLSADQALPILFDWFFANGGTTRQTRTAPNIPGVTTRVGAGMISPNSDEVSVGLARTLGSRGDVRVDWIYREYDDFYGDFRNTSTGTVTDPTGRVFDLVIVNNTNNVERTYKGLNGQVSYRFGTRLYLGGNYTLSWARGNFTGEDSGSGPVRASADDFPEYRDARWNSPVGYTPNDQRHKLRVWSHYELPLAERLGHVSVGLQQRFDSGEASSADGTIDPRPYVTNPGYITPPSSVTYFFGERGDLRTDDIWRTDVSLLWELRLPVVPRGRLFFRGVITNVFNNAGLVAFDEQILTRNNDAGFAPFNPFTETPIQGTHWDFGPDFGKPTGVGDYQAPREFSFSVGVRF